MKEICAICKDSFDEEKKFTHHINYFHKLKMEVYYTTHCPKYDLLSGELIRYKNKEFYQSSLFNTRANMVKYINSLDNPLQRKSAIKQIIEMRQYIKEYPFAPSTIETRTSILPSPLMMQKYNLNYNEIWKESKASPRYNYDQILKFGSDKNLTIYIDTREQKPIRFDCAAIVKTLPFGDYEEISNSKLTIERKSLSDLCGTLSAGYERFQREIEKSINAKKTLLICVETDANTLQSYNYLPHLKHIKATPEFICHRMRDLCQKYPSVQFLLLKNRKEMARAIPKIFTIQNNPAQIDYQYFYDKKTL